MTKLLLRTIGLTYNKVYTGAVHFTCSTIVSVDIKAPDQQTMNAVFLVITRSETGVVHVLYVSKIKYKMSFKAPPGHLLGTKASVLCFTHTKYILMPHKMNWVLSQRCKQVTFR